MKGLKAQKKLLNRNCAQCVKSFSFLPAIRDEDRFIDTVARVERVVGFRTGARAYIKGKMTENETKSTNSDGSFC